MALITVVNRSNRPVDLPSGRVLAPRESARVPDDPKIRAKSTLLDVVPEPEKADEDAKHDEKPRTRQPKES